MASIGPTLVIGLGNPLMGDDGIGLELLAYMREHWSFDPEVLFADGGTWGMNLLPLIEDAGRVLFLDAVNTGQPAGTPVRLFRDRIPRWLGHKLSPHQIDLKEVLALAELRGTLPRYAVVVGIQPGIIEMQIGLSPAAAESVELAADLARSTLEGWGHRALRESGIAVYA
jgi:hydrogenase maturation protease